jgi:hypothetical protein
MRHHGLPAGQEGAARTDEPAEQEQALSNPARVRGWALHRLLLTLAPHGGAHLFCSFVSSSSKFVLCLLHPLHPFAHKNDNQRGRKQNKIKQNVEKKKKKKKNQTKLKNKRRMNNITTNQNQHIRGRWRWANGEVARCREGHKTWQRRIEFCIFPAPVAGERTLEVGIITRRMCKGAKAVAGGTCKNKKVQRADAARSRIATVCVDCVFRVSLGEVYSISECK